MNYQRSFSIVCSKFFGCFEVTTRGIVTIVGDTIEFSSEAREWNVEVDTCLHEFVWHYDGTMGRVTRHETFS